MSHAGGVIQERGAIALFALALLVALVIIFGATIRWIARQSHQTVNQEQEEQAFGLADAGVEYTLWLLTPKGGGFTPQTLLAGSPDTVRRHPIVESNGSVLGYFTVEYLSVNEGKLSLRSEGWDAVRPDICQVVEATVTPFAGGSFQVTAWEHLIRFTCKYAS